MNEQKVSELARDVAEFVWSRIDGTDINGIEVSRALGEVLAIVIGEPLWKQIEKLEKSQHQPDEDEQEDEDEDEFELRSHEERGFVFQSLVGKYSPKALLEIGQGVRPIPKWLQKEILERRG